MSVNDVALALHDKATRGMTLSAEEQIERDQWYAGQDQTERVILKAGTSSSVVHELQTQVTAALERCVTLAQRIQDLSHDNDVLRRDVAQLGKHMTRLLQPA